MHGIRKSDVPLTAEEEAAMLELVKKYKEVSTEVMKLKAAKQYDRHALQLSAHVVVLNPEFWIIWAFRRAIILHLIQQDSSLKEELGNAECALTQEALMKNPKSYASWFQREWLMKQGLANLEKEIKLCDKLLNLDERNFHCWNYRRIVTKTAHTPLDEVLAFTMTKIEQNFSNYSAFQQRSLILPSPLPLEVAMIEIELVKQAVFTEPDDQSNWFYYRWLIQSLVKSPPPMPSPRVVDADDNSDDEGFEMTLHGILIEQVHWIDELVELEPESKMALVTLAFVLEVEATFDRDSFAQSASTSLKRCKEVYQTLQEIDPDHVHYYEDRIKALKV
ncbi:geranylgeranyl transferase type-2 subunit alpha [Thraustotheca clavata]|uniref:Geranylgeranyl transferase type-2 subunit alpha n=1 Tax=Thraustotheca clavata TaxID=74557 RepID=A0A1W0A0E1_9STRA|nr:geranylgeranyl transferase type-2 subunit alpha [Thraustotheca clavata]